MIGQSEREAGSGEIHVSDWSCGSTPRSSRRHLGLVVLEEAGFRLWRRVFCSACCGVAGGMSAPNGETRGAAGEEGPAAAGPFSFSPEPTLEDM